MSPVPIQIAALVLVALGAFAVVLTRDTVRLTFVSSIYAVLLVVLFLVFQAPDVALSMLVVGAVGYPLVVLVSIARARGRHDEDE